MYKIAYVDDYEMNCGLFDLLIKQHSHLPLIYRSPAQYLLNPPKELPDCIISDIYMPEMDGFKFYENLTADPKYKRLPFFFISYDDSEKIRIKSFETGAIDFLNRYMSPDEMFLRVKSRIELFKQHNNSPSIGSLKTDMEEMKVFLAEKDLNLTFTEFKILIFLVRNFPDVTTKEKIVHSIWGENGIKDATLYTHIGNLQDKLLNWDYEIVSAKNKGFFIRQRFDEDPSLVK